MSFGRFIKRRNAAAAASPPPPPPPPPPPASPVEEIFGDGGGYWGDSWSFMDVSERPPDYLGDLKYLSKEYAYKTSIGQDPGITQEQIAEAARAAIAAGHTQKEVEDYSNKGLKEADESYKAFNDARLSYLQNRPTSWDSNNPPPNFVWEGVEYPDAQFGGFKPGSSGHSALMRIAENSSPLVYAATGLRKIGTPWTGESVEYYQNKINENVQAALAAGVPQAEIERIYNKSTASALERVNTPSGFDRLLSSIGSVVKPLQTAFNIALPVVTTVISGGIAGPAGLGLSGISAGAVAGAVSGGITAGLRGQDVVEGALLGGATGGAAGAVGSAVSGAVGGAAGAVAGGAASSATSAGIRSLLKGDNPNTPQDESDILNEMFQGALTGGISSGVAQLGGEYLSDVPLPLRQGLVAATTAELLGGDGKTAFVNSVLSTLPAYLRDQTSTKDIIKKAYNDSSRGLDLLPEADKAFVNQLAEQDIAYAQEIYGDETGQRLTDAQLRKAFSQGKPFDYIDNLYTTEAEAKDIWKATVGTEPTEYDLLGLIGLDTGQVTSQVQGIADDRSSVSSEELDEFLRDIGKGQITLTPEEQMDLLGGSEVAARNAIAGKWNEFVDNFNANLSGTKLAEYTRIVDGALKAKGIDPNRITTEDRQKLMTAAYGRYGDNIDKLKSASIQDFINGNTRTLQQVIDAQSSADLRFIIAGNLPVYAGSSQERKGAASDYIPEGLGLATEKEIDSGAATKINLPNGGIAWVVSKEPDEVDLPDWFKQDVELERLQGQNPWETDPEAALFTYAQFDTPQKGGADALIINSAKSIVNLVNTTGLDQGTKETIIDLAVSVPLQGLAELTQLYSDAIWGTGLVDRNNLAKVTADAVAKYGKSLQSATTQQQEANILKAISDAKGMGGTIKATFNAAVDNFPGLLTLVGKEAVQEIPVLMASGGVGRLALGLAGKGAAYSAAMGTSAVMDAFESGGANLGETYDNVRKAGGSHDYAMAQAQKAGLQAAAIGAISSGLGDSALVKKFLGEMNTLTVAQFTKEVAKQYATEWGEEFLQNASVQYNSFGKVDWDQARTAGAIGGLLGAGTAAGILGPTAINYNMDVALRAEGVGQPVTLKQYLSGEVQVAPGSFDINAVPITIGGAPVSLGDFTKVVDTSLSDPNFSFTSYKTNLEGLAKVDYGGSGLSDIALAVTQAPNSTTLINQLKNLGLDSVEQANVADIKYDNLFTSSDEIKKIFNNLGYTPTQAEIASYVGQKTESIQKGLITNYVAPRYTTEAEAEKFFADLGYTPTAAELKSFVGQKSDATQKTAIGTYVDQNTVTEAEARAALKDSGIAEPTQEMVNSLVGQYSQTQLATKANEMLTGYMTADQTNKAISDAISGIEFPAGISKEDVAAEIKKYAEANPGLSLNDVTTAITTELGKLPDYATPEDVTKALDTALAGYATQANVDAATKTLQEAIDAAQAGNTTRFDEIDQAIQDLRDAGLTEDQVQSVVDASAKGLSTQFKDALDASVAGNTEALGTLKTDLETQIGDVQTALETALGEQGAAFTEQVAALMEQGQSYQEAVDNALAALGADIGSLGEDVATKLADLDTTLGERIGGLETELGDVETRLTEAIATAEAAGLSRDQAIEAALNTVAADLGTTKEDLLGQLGTVESTLRSEIEASQAALGEQLTDVEGRLTQAIADAEAAGLSRDEAIQAAVDAVAADLGTTREDLLTQLGTTEEALRTEFQAGQEALGEQISTGIEGLQTALADAETRINERAAEYEAAGLSRDQALQTAISDVATQLGTTAQNLEQQIFAAQSALSEQITGVQTGLQQQIQDVATVLGKPAQDVTQADIDLVNQMIEGQVETDLTYDANQDGVIDQNDIAFLTSITTGTEPPEWPQGTRWAPTGVYGQIAGLEDELTRQLEEQERAAQGRFQQQQQQQRVQQFMGMLTQPGALQQKVQVKAPEVMKLEQLYGGLYDPTAGLFRTPQQQQFFASPYGNYFDGGEVTEDELLAIVRG